MENLSCPLLSNFGSVPARWPSKLPEAGISREDIEIRLFRGLLIATPMGLLLWLGIYALVRAWL